MFEFNNNLKEEMEKKRYNYKEVHDIVNMIFKKLRQQQYIWVFLTGLLSPLIVSYVYKKYPNLIGIFSGAVSFTFLVYVYDETIKTYCDYKVKHDDRFQPMSSKSNQNEKKEKEKDDE